MARIAGVDLPRDLRIDMALTSIYGIGRPASRRVIQETGLDPSKRVRDLTETEVSELRSVIDKNYRVEGDLRRQVNMDIRRLIEIGSYRGLRHRRGLPVRGQRTSTNARTRKGPRRTVGAKRKKK
jgi:small subunit ribosomal protein S13